MRRSAGIDGRGAAWAVGAFVASLLIGLIIEPSRATIGLENVVILYLLVVVAAAAIGGRAAGMAAAVSAALAYDYFLTTPYHTLVIDSLAQVITVALLVATGIVVSIGGRVRRRSAAAAEAHADAIRLLHRVTETAAAGGPRRPGRRPGPPTAARGPSRQRPAPQPGRLHRRRGHRRHPVTA